MRGFASFLTTDGRKWRVRASQVAFIRERPCEENGNPVTSIDGVLVYASFVDACARIAAVELGEEHE